MRGPRSADVYFQGQTGTLDFRLLDWHSFPGVSAAAGGRNK